MIFRTKKVIGMLLFLVFSTTAIMAQDAQTKITDEEISKFATTFQQMRMMNQEVQMAMGEAIKNEDLEIARFNEIHKATMDPAAEVEVTAEEQKKYDNIVSDIEEMQIGFQKKMEDTITASGLSLERYQQIATKLQTDPELQERLRAEFQQE